MTAHAAGDERLGDVVVGEQLALGPRELQVVIAGSVEVRAPASDRGRDRGDAPADAGVDLGALLGGEHRAQRRDRDLELVEIGLTGREPLQPAARAA